MAGAVLTDSVFKAVGAITFIVIQTVAVYNFILSSVEEKHTLAIAKIEQVEKRVSKIETEMLLANKDIQHNSNVVSEVRELRSQVLDIERLVSDIFKKTLKYDQAKK